MTPVGPSIHYRFGPFEFQVDEWRLLKEGAAVAMRPQALEVLRALVDQPGRLLTKDELMRRVWGQVIVEENTLQAHISALRKVLGPDAIATVSGRGYRFALLVAPAKEPAKPPTPPHNLPQQLTSFVGRGNEIAQITQMLSSTRLLTLTGAGGCGKTRLALQVAATVLDQYPDGVWFVELAPLSDPTLIVQAVAKALEVQEQTGKDLAETLVERLGSRRQLLLLDNAEHLLDACARLAEHLLQRCSLLAVLVTSRERLGIAGEMTYRVPSLSVPEARHDTTRDEVLAFEATRLFIERARLHRPDFDVTGKDAAALALVCRRLDGIALAIELAAPRVRAMSLEELSTRIGDRFAVLTGGSRTALPRHRTLRSLVDWSHDLLGDAEKAVLRRASVFAGGWTLEAAERVCSGDGVDRTEMLDLLTSLADKNLAVAETHTDDTRFGMLETVRHYAQDRLRESGEAEAVRDDHVEFFLAMARALLDPLQNDSELQAKLLRLDREHDNVRAALAWCEAAAGACHERTGARGRALLVLANAGSLRRRARLDRPTSGRCADCRAPRRSRQRVACRRCSDATSRATTRRPRCRQREALAIWRNVGNRRGVSRSLNSLGKHRQLTRRAVGCAPALRRSLVHRPRDRRSAQRLHEPALPGDGCPRFGRLRRRTSAAGGVRVPQPRYRGLESGGGAFGVGRGEARTG